ncbi:pyridoxamine 5'-phosphate oxidase family protein [Microbacterium sp. BF1]|uniref:pyridoxamine 5'-phosphate oxidase family protein n=1 Tax=Microbacterium sp. BF1 TaxID=2821146 RepID=UPI00277D07DE|nr:pyridoxamine 5'-phosphate oxidase family protein [Microbacterium sp. BF1]
MTEITGPEALARVAELVEDIDITMLTTTDDDGNLVSRPMSTRQMDDAGDIWFFTSEDTVSPAATKRMRGSYTRQHAMAASEGASRPAHRPWRRDSATSRSRSP